MIDDSADPNFEDGKNKEPENRDISNEFDEEYLEYVEDIQNSTSESYYDFFCYLVNDCGFEFRFLGDDNYYSSAKGVIVKVVKKATTVVCTMTSCYYNEKLNITLKDSNGNVLANKKVTFQFNNDHIYKRTTDSNGRASLPINLKNNTYHFTIRFLGDNCYSMSSKTVNLKVKKAPAKVTVPTYHVRYNSGIYFNVTVKNNKTNNPISGVKINLNVSAGNTYKYYNITTNASGIARINLSKLSVGTHQVIISSLNPSVVFAKITKTIKILSA